jgi:hypothetical protein
MWCASTHLVECKHLPDHLPAVLKRHLHAVIDLRVVSWMRAWAEMERLLGFAVTRDVSQFLCASSLRARPRVAG